MSQATFLLCPLRNLDNQECNPGMNRIPAQQFLLVNPQSPTIGNKKRLFRKCSDDVLPVSTIMRLRLPVWGCGLVSPAEKSAVRFRPDHRVGASFFSSNQEQNGNRTTPRAVTTNE